MLLKFHPNLLFLIIIFYISSCDLDDTKISYDWVAIVNGTPIKSKTFINELSRRISGSYNSNDYANNLRSVAKVLLNEKIEETLMLNEANKNNVIILDTELEKEISKIKMSLPGGVLEDFLLESSITKAEFIQSTKIRLTIERFLIKFLANNIWVSDLEALCYFVDNYSIFNKRKKLRARQIVLQTKAEALKILEMINTGNSFSELAELYSISPEKLKGGDLGYFEKDDLPDIIVKTVERLRPGMVSKIVENPPYGFHIIQRLETSRNFKFKIKDIIIKIKRILIKKRFAFKEKSYIRTLLKNARVVFRLEEVLKNSKLVPIRKYNRNLEN